MIDDIATQKLLAEFRGEAAVDRDQLIDVLVGLGRLAEERPDVASVDINPLIVQPDGRVDRRRWPGRAVDDAAGGRRSRHHPTASDRRAVPCPLRTPRRARHRRVEPPGKFGFVSLHNLLASGYAGGVFGTNLKGEEVLGIKTVAEIADLPDGAIDLVFVCTPARPTPTCSARVPPKAFGPRS